MSRAPHGSPSSPSPADDWHPYRPRRLDRPGDFAVPFACLLFAAGVVGFHLDRIARRHAAPHAVSAVVSPSNPTPVSET